MDMINFPGRIGRRFALAAGALVLCFSLVAQADDIQDANKLFKQRQYDEALAKVESVLAAKPKDAQARFLKALIFIDQGKVNDAIGILSALTDDYPDLPEPYNNLAVLYASQSQYDKAKTALEMAIRINPSYATAHENLGDLYAKMASQEYTRAEQLDHTNPSPKAKRGVIEQLFARNSTAARAPAAPAAPIAPASAPAAAPAAAKH